VVIVLSINEGSLSYGRVQTPLTEKEFKMMEFFMKEQLFNKNKVNYDNLVRHVWEGRECVITLNTVSQLAYRLREKMKIINAPITIKISSKNHCHISFWKRCVLVVLDKSLLKSRVTIVR
jgi:DNA-binding response OmpR family regulator